MATFFQLRREGDPHEPWTISFLQMCEPHATLTHVFLSTFTGCRDDLNGLCTRLRKTSPRLVEVTVACDWRYTDMAYTSAERPTANPGFVELEMPAFHDIRDRLIVTAVFPKVEDGVDRKRDSRASHGIHHTKLFLARHGDGVGSPAHLRVQLASANLDNLRTVGKGEAVWRSPVLVRDRQIDLGRVMPFTEGGRRFGHPLLKLMEGLTKESRPHSRVQAAGRPPRLHERLQRWWTVLPEYRLESVPPSVSLVVSMPGYHPQRPDVAPGLLGSLGGKLMGWDKDGGCADALDLLLANAADDGATGDAVAPRCWSDGIELRREPENPSDRNAVAVWCSESKIGYISQNDAVALARLLDESLAPVTVELEMWPAKTSKGAAAPPPSEGQVALSPRLQGTRWYIQIDVLHATPASSDSMLHLYSPLRWRYMWCTLAASMRTNLGIARLREVLRPVGQVLDERTALVSYSPCFGAKGIDGWLHQVTSAIEGTPDIDGWLKPRLVEEALRRELGDDEGDLAKMPKYSTKDGVDTLLGLLRSELQPTADGPRGVPVPSLPKVLVPAVAFVRFAMGEKSSVAALGNPSSGGSSVLCDISPDSGASVHPRIASLPGQGFKQRVVHSHAKYILATFEAVEPAGAAPVPCGEASPHISTPAAHCAKLALPNLAGTVSATSARTTSRPRPGAPLGAPARATLARDWPRGRRAWSSPCRAPRRWSSAGRRRRTYSPSTAGQYTSTRVTSCRTTTTP